MTNEVFRKEGLGEAPYSNMAVHDFIWSNATYSTNSLMAKYSEKFPFIVMVTRGYYGHDDIGTLASSQVARLHTWVNQRRVLARDSRGRMLSIPLDYEIAFQVIDRKGKRGKTKSLKTIIDDYRLPVTVEFERKRIYRFNIGSVRYSSRDFGKMVIERVYVERFLKGNTIHEGIIDDKVMLVPMYVRVRFKVARGLKGKTEEDWVNLQGMYTRAVRNTHVERIDGTKDIMLHPNKVSLPEDDKHEDDDDDDDVTNDVEFDANANLTNAENKERSGSMKSGGRRSKKSRSRSRSSSAERRKGKYKTIDISNSDDTIEMQPNSTMVMSLKRDDRRMKMSNYNNPYHLRSDTSDVSTMSGDDYPRGLRHQNIVRVNLSEDAEVVTNELYNGDPYRERPSYGSTIVNVTNDDMMMSAPRNSYATYSHPTNSLRRAFSDEFLDTSVFYPSNTARVDSIPNYGTSRRYRPNYTSFSSSDGRYAPRQTSRTKYGMRLIGGAPIDRRYHSLKDLSSVGLQSQATNVQYVQESEPVRRHYSIRSSTVSPSPPSSRLGHNVLHANNPDNFHVSIVNDAEPTTGRYVAYVRSAGHTRPPPLSPTTQTRRHERHVNQGVYYTDGNENYTVKSTRTAPRRPPPSYDDLDFVQVIEEDYTQSDANVHVPRHRPAVRQTALHSPVQSSSSGEETRRYTTAYNGSTAGTDEVDHSTHSDYMYRGSVTLRRASLDDHIDIGNGSMFEVPITDLRTAGLGRVEHMHATTTAERAPVHASNYAQRRQHAQTTMTRHETSSQPDFDSDGMVNGEVAHGQVDMTKGAAEHWARSMDLDTSYTTKQVPVEVEGRIKSFNEDMFEGGHHSFAKDRHVCRRLDLQRQERNLSHKAHILDDHFIHGGRKGHSNVIRITRTAAPPEFSRVSPADYSYSNVNKYQGKDRSGFTYYAVNDVNLAAPRLRSDYSDLGVARIVTEGESSALLEDAMNAEGSSADVTESSALHEGSRMVEEGTSGYVTTTVTTSTSARELETEDTAPKESVSSTYTETISSSGTGGKEGHHDFQHHYDDAVHGAGGKEGHYDFQHHYDDAVHGAGGKEGHYDFQHHYDDAVQGSESAEHQTALNNVGTSYTTTTTTVETVGHKERERERSRERSWERGREREEKEREALINTRISRKKGRELTRTGSVNSLREVYARSRSPSGERQAKPTMAVAPVTDVFEDILNRPSVSATTSAGTAASKTTTTTTQETQQHSTSPGTSGIVSEITQVVRRHRANGPAATRDYVNSGTSSKMFDTHDLDGNGPAQGEELAWQETQSYHLESIRDSIRDLDEYLKDQGGESDSHSLSSATSSKHLEHFSFALTDEVTSF